MGAISFSDLWDISQPFCPYLSIRRRGALFILNLVLQQGRSVSVEPTQPMREKRQGSFPLLSKKFFNLTFPEILSISQTILSFFSSGFVFVLLFFFHLHFFLSITDTEIKENISFLGRNFLQFVLAFLLKKYFHTSSMREKQCFQLKRIQLFSLAAVFLSNFARFFLFCFVFFFFPDFSREFFSFSLTFPDSQKVFPEIG